MAASRSSGVVIRSGSTAWMRNGSMIVRKLGGVAVTLACAAARLAQIRRRSVAHLVSWWRVESWSLRNTADTWLSTVLIASGVVIRSGSTAWMRNGSMIVRKLGGVAVTK